MWLGICFDRGPEPVSTIKIDQSLLRSCIQLSAEHRTSVRLKFHAVCRL